MGSRHWRERRMRNHRCKGLEKEPAGARPDGMEVGVGGVLLGRREGAHKKMLLTQVGSMFSSSVKCGDGSHSGIFSRYM